MCNEIRRRIALDEVRDVFAHLRIPLRFPEGLPNLPPLESVRITDPNPIVRLDENGLPELVMRRWSWPAPSGKPVYNLRSEGRNFARSRCLILADGFYEFTAPDDPKANRKTKWLFTKKDEPLICIAGTTRQSPAGEAFSMLTSEPGPDIAPYHKRQIVIVEPRDWARWLDPTVPSVEFLRPLPAGSLSVERVA